MTCLKIIDHSKNHTCKCIATKDKYFENDILFLNKILQTQTKRKAFLKNVTLSSNTKKD